MSLLENGNSQAGADTPANEKKAPSVLLRPPFSNLGSLLVGGLSIALATYTWQAHETRQEAKALLEKAQELTEGLMAYREELLSQFHPCDESQKAQVTDVRDYIASNLEPLKERLIQTAGPILSEEDISASLKATLDVHVFCAQHSSMDPLGGVITAETIRFDDAASFSLSPAFFCWC
ncbi:hypothetical protein IPG41_03420 [Candidatus Peregrinibacteria bacterium]|nr:MAG: hypothetical protein IPG41_03420 [Candidatus Peregrinibacteria bacterium]